DYARQRGERAPPRPPVRRRVDLDDVAGDGVGREDGAVAIPHDAGADEGDPRGGPVGLEAQALDLRVAELALRDPDRSVAERDPVADAAARGEGDAEVAVVRGVDAENRGVVGQREPRVALAHG